ncbi:hypothetical protein [Mycolicibacterium farcinogenes]|uniref:hypothetical protein n=1 Tax=Mycolicibacterium farcinogenes TaxID=1802 RepID=UPI001FD29049|nr:hypothetical protein [Mycolicibacterium farcinogenes]
MAAALWAKVIIDAAPWVLEDLRPPDGARYISKAMTGGLDYYIASLKWGLVAVTLCLFAAATAGVLIGIHRGLEALHVWLSDYQTPDDEEANLTRAARMRMAWRIGRAERRFARTLVLLVGPASRKRRGSVLWEVLPGTGVRATLFSVRPALDYYAISGEEVVAFMDNARRRAEIQSVEYRDTAEDCGFVVQWNCDYLTRPLIPAKDTSTGTLSFGVPARERLRRSAGIVTLVVGLVVVAIAAWALTPDRGVHTPAYTATLPEPQGQRSALIPMSEGGESSGRCTAGGVCSGEVFAMDLGSDGPWVVTSVGYRPLEVLPGRRVTRLRWELRDTDVRSDRDTVEFTQTSDAPKPGMEVTFARVRVDGRRVMRIRAVVEASLPAPGAVRTGLGPFEVYGYRDRGAEILKSAG